MTTTPPDNAGLAENTWREALASAVESHRRHDLSEWELHLIGRRVEAALRPSVWMDISTAPKDGTPIMVAVGKQVYIVRWQTMKRAPDRWAHWGGTAMYSQPAYWMPLPSAPTPPKAPTP